MNSIEFLKGKLSELYKKNSYLEIKYEFRGYINTHIIEIKPVHCFEKDKEYMLCQIAIEEEFEQLFPNEAILFMTENILIQIDSPILELGVSTIITYGDLDAIECQSMFSANDLYYDFSECVIVDAETYKSNKVELVGVYYQPPINTKSNESQKKDSDVISESFFLINFAA